ncbi:pentapeptide repeat-containing protein [Streptomyces antimycoticus]|uniref:pentapeptide repeat-containing protein n=1 Tax=Streptomyces antimycoticus TaxID=68175 RepID=UPI0036AFBF48
MNNREAADLRGGSALRAPGEVERHSKDVKGWAPGQPPGDPEAAQRLQEWLQGEEGGLDVAGLDFSGADLSQGDFSESWFTGSKLVNVKLIDADLYRSDAQGADFTGADLTRVSLVRVNLDDAVLRRAILDGADLVKASLCDVDASRASCRGTRFMGASLLYVDLRGADLTDAVLRENSFKVAMNHATILQGVSGSIFGPVEILEQDSVRTLGGAALEDWIREKGGNVQVISGTCPMKYRSPKSPT